MKELKDCSKKMNDERVKNKIKLFRPLAVIFLAAGIWTSLCFADPLENNALPVVNDPGTASVVTDPTTSTMTCGIIIQVVHFNGVIFQAIKFPFILFNAIRVHILNNLPVTGAKCPCVIWLANGTLNQGISNVDR